ncbi:hypothetical protein FUAX_01980 [Fulvitalea axinellae]|uniref:Uncharacterized protein n=1 Tax=Fulvitalea axinellae TaxID=1182444 RepID=A0AAU9D4N2_9BACT|nr:hypothetical protein FUAX_01980 [Fulvitalea axinellae]
MKSIEINIEGKEIVFKQNDEYWIANILFDSNEITFEVYHEKIDVIKIRSILAYVGTPKFFALKSEAEKMLELLGMSFWKNEHQKCLFEFNGFVIEPHESSELDFQLCYSLTLASSNYSDYANWVVDIWAQKIVGVRREQL